MTMSEHASPCPLEFRWSSFDELDVHTLYALLRLRSEVFLIEQECNYLDLDGHDQVALHLVAYEQGALCGYLRLLPPGSRLKEASLGRIVIPREQRGRHWGRALIAEGLRVARQHYPGAPLRISAQSRLLDYYRGFGFEVVDAPYDEGGLPHQDMMLKSDT